MDINLDIEKCTNYILSKVNATDPRNSKVLIISNYDIDLVSSLSDLGATITHLIIDEKINNTEFVRLPYVDNHFDVCITFLPSQTLGNSLKLLTLYTELIRASKTKGTCLIIDELEIDFINKINLENEFNAFIELSESIETKDRKTKLIGMTVGKKKKHPSAYNSVLTKDLLTDYFKFYSNDQVLIDILLLDFWARKYNLPIVSSGRYEDQSYILERSYRVWEYRQIIKGLQLEKRKGGSILDIGGASCHLTYYASIYGYNVTSLDINPKIIEMQKRTSEFMKIDNLKTLIMDMRDLSDFEDNSFDMAMSASVFEHLTAEDQIKSIKEIARVVKPGGKIAISFDYGIPAPGANPDLPPPHDPPSTSLEVIRRYCDETGLVFQHEPFSSFMYPFWETVYYSPSFILLTKTGADIDISENTSDVWQLEKSIILTKYGDYQLLGDFMGYLIEKDEINSTSFKETLIKMNYKIDEKENDREQRLNLINKQTNIIHNLGEQIEVINKDSLERLDVINKQQNMIQQFDSERESFLSESLRKDQINIEQLQVINNQEGIIKELGKEYEERLQLIKHQEDIINQIQKELNDYKGDIFIRLLAKWRIKDGK